jgi:ABC-2 type transport system permease protein
VSWLIFVLTLRRLALRRSTLLFIGLAALPLLVALVFRISDPEDVVPERWTARVLYVGFVVAIVLPLISLMLGVSALGDEFEDGTAIYLLTKPVSRWAILLPKLAASLVLTVAIVLPATVLSGLLALDRFDSLVTGFAVAIIIGALAYCALFTLLSVWTNRALIAGLAYVFLWEGLITTVFTGTRYLSIRHFTMGLAGDIADKDPFIFNPTVSAQTALIMFAIIIVVAVVYSNLRLQRSEIREAT